ncbi:MAG: thioredoxin-disulfide reductase [Candidatus Bathyarchaeota archaeon]
MSEDYELIIIGSGPAGLAAGIYSARKETRTLIISDMRGGKAAEACLVENYPGFMQISGLELTEKMREQAEKWGATVHDLEVALKLDLNEKKKEVKTNKGTYASDAIIIATGCTHTKLDVPGEKEFTGKGVSYCATCDGPLFRGKKTMVIGGGNSAAIEALYLKDIANKVYLVHRKDDLRADAVFKRKIAENNVEVLWNSEVKAIEGDQVVKRVRVFDNKTNEEKMVDVDGVFIYIGEAPRNEISSEAGILVDDESYIVVNKKQETNIEAVFAAGDVTGGVRQIGTAVGEGITAAVNACLYIRGGIYCKT